MSTPLAVPPPPRRRRQSSRGAVIGAVTAVGLMAAIIVGLIGLALVRAVQLRHDAQRSSRIEHGTLVASTVTGVDVEDHTSTHGGDTYTTTITGRLDEAGRPATTTTVQGRVQDLASGDRILVLHAPGVPAVSELPGHPQGSLRSAVAALLGGLAGLTIIGMVVLAVVRAALGRRPGTRRGRNGARGLVLVLLLGIAAIGVEASSPSGRSGRTVAVPTIAAAP